MNEKQKRASLLAFLFLLNILTAGQSSPKLILTEVMFRPHGSNNEFIEIYNPSTVYSFDLKGVKLKYYKSSPDFIDTTQANLILPPETYAVIFEGDYNISGGIYSTLIPPNAIQLKISDNAFGSSGMSNSSNRPIYLLDSNGDTLDAYVYTANNKEGFSDERIFVDSLHLNNSWGNSIIENGTPGYKNSITPFNNDVSIENISLSPVNPVEGSTIQAKVKINNIGLFEAYNFSFDFFDDVNGDSLLQPNELLFEKSNLQLQSFDSLTLSFQFNLSAGAHFLIGKTNFPADEDSSNNHYLMRFYVYPKPVSFNAIVINEIMFKPAEGNPEWIELFNNSKNSINLKGWKIKDKTTSTIISRNNISVKPDSFLVISADSLNLKGQTPFNYLIVNLPSLNNSGDEITLLDSLNRTIDSVNYSSGWGGGRGRSLERIYASNASNLPSNWGSSVSRFGSTPSRINSLTPKDFDLGLKRLISSAPYNQLNTNLNLTAIISNNGNKSNSGATFNIYLDSNKDSIAQSGELIFTNSLPPIFPKDSLTLDLTIAPLPKGLNYLIAKINYSADEFPDNDVAFLKINTVEFNEIKGDIVINEIMYAPKNDEPEWIELFNTSAKTINLKNYSVGDDHSLKLAIEKSLVLKPGTFVVVAKDSSFFKYHAVNPVVIAGFPVLNNLRDAVVIKDSLLRTIDSVYYFNSWGGAGGKSLERISPSGGSLDSANWAECRYSSGSTPGKVNSVSQKNYDVAITRFFTDPPFPLQHQKVNLFCVLKNIGKKTLSFNLTLLIAKSSNGYVPVFNSGNFTLQPNDSINKRLDYLIPDLNDVYSLKIKANSSADENPSNNSDSLTIFPVYPKSSLVINEIMYNPEDEPEWVEFFNTTDDTLNILNWKVADVLTTPDTSFLTNSSYYILPGEYLVLAKDSSFFNFHKLSRNVIITDFANLNNGKDGVKILDGTNNLIDSVFYSDNYFHANGRSIERVSPSKPSNDLNNWKVSKSKYFSTPGIINSVSPKNYDVSIDSIFCSPPYPQSSQEITINAIVRNNGMKNLGNLPIIFYVFNGSKYEQFDSLTIQYLNDHDSTIAKSSRGQIVRDSLKIKVVAGLNNDQDTTNNYYLKTIYSNNAKGKLFISEIMCRPKAGSPQWIELANISGDEINLNNWTLTTNSKTFILLSPARCLTILPHSFFVIATDTLATLPQETPLLTIPKLRLRFYSDKIKLSDFRGETIDSVFYSRNWRVITSHSIEKINLSSYTNDSTNWFFSLAQNNSTPGAKNSVATLTAYPLNSCAINEIMFNPVKGNAEYVEILNKSGSSINIGGWYLSTSAANGYFLRFNNFVLQKNSFYLLASDSSIYSTFNYLTADDKIRIVNSSSLNISNSGAPIVLKDAFGNVIDSVFFQPSWHNKNILNTDGKSLERINPLLNSNDAFNWNTSVAANGGTPNKVNSIYTQTAKTKSALNISPNPFSPDNDGFQDFTIISFKLAAPESQVMIRIFDDHGRLVRTLVNNQAFSSSGSVVFDGLDDNGNLLRMGIYLVLVQSVNEKNKQAQTLKGVLVLAHKLN